jgi:hypothetical protein
MRSIKQVLDSITLEEFGTIRLALMGWSERCNAEAKMMDEWSREEGREPHLIEKCKANAEASRKFKADADALLEKLRNR